MMETHLDVVRLPCLGIDDGAGGCGAPGVLSHLPHTVYIHLEVAAALHVEHILSVLGGFKHCLILGGEVFYLYAGGEVVHARRGHSHRRGIVACGDALAAHRGVVPEGAFHTRFAVEGTLVAHQAFHHLVVGKVATGEVQQFALFRLDAVEDGDGVVGHAVVVAPHHRRVVGIRSDDGYLSTVLLQRQHVVVVLQQHD